MKPKNWLTYQRGFSEQRGSTTRPPDAPAAPPSTGAASLDADDDIHLTLELLEQTPFHGHERVASAARLALLARGRRGTLPPPNLL